LQGTSQLQKQIAYFVGIITVLSISTGVICIIVWAAWLQKDYPGFMSIAAIIATAVSSQLLLFLHFVF
jgi:sodium/potassium-transporting ATPase subunit alpha